MQSYIHGNYLLCRYGGGLLVFMAYDFFIATSVVEPLNRHMLSNTSDFNFHFNLCLHFFITMLDLYFTKKGINVLKKWRHLIMKIIVVSNRKDGILG